MDRRIDRADAPDERHAAGHVRQPWVDDHDVGPLVADQGDGLGDLAGAADDGEAVSDAEDPDQALARAVIGVDDEQAKPAGDR